MNKTEALKLALEALELHGKQYPHMVKGYCVDAITAGHEALAQPDHIEDNLAMVKPEQEPVGYFVIDVADLIAGEFNVSRGAAYDLMRDSLAEAQPEQEPVVYIRKDQLQRAAQYAMLCEVTPEPRQDRIRIYTAPPKREWVGLTRDDKSNLWEVSRAALPRYATYAILVEEKLKDKNHE